MKVETEYTAQEFQSDERHIILHNKLDKLSQQQGKLVDMLRTLKNRVDKLEKQNEKLNQTLDERLNQTLDQTLNNA